MSRWISPQPLELQLFYDDILVADLHEVIAHQGTWFASYELRISSGEGVQQDRLLEYIASCEDFDRRIAQGEDRDFDEFDRYGVIAAASSWRVPRPDGGDFLMEGNMWFADGEVCWQHPETKPSTEEAANVVWACIANYVAGSAPKN
jgi:hypothetical protein